MVSIYSVEPNKLIEKAAEELKKINDIKPPSWAAFVRTGISKERPPTQKDWWYIRAAAVLRSVYKLGPIGVSKLRTRYGSKKNRGHKPEHFYPASGNIIRKILQQLEKAELIKKGEVGVHKGRVIAPKGKSILDKTAVIILKSMPKKEIKKEEIKEKPEKKEIKEKKPKEEIKEKPEPKKEQPKEEAKAEEKPEEVKEPKKEETKPEEKPKERKEESEVKPKEE
ncbi:30S ribosomal protein S19e [Candidatus Woesearchaeota archaeon]|nr:30S ribosomal protein S19e [Candidatus Woesearchaeota archaeon]